MDFSVYINQKPTSNHGFDGIQKRTRLKWVEDNSVTSCFKCHSEFNWLSRRHHCRYEGRVYCGNCTSRRAVIPADVPIPEPTHGTFDGRDPSVPLRVCDDCFVKLHQLRRVHDAPTSWNAFTAFIEWVYDIKDLKRISMVCLQWNKIANYHLSRFFELQYHLPGHSYLYWHRSMLWANRLHFVGHSVWMVQLIRSIPYQTTEGLSRLQEIQRLIVEHLNQPIQERKPGDYKHWNLMCTRSCKNYGFTFEEIILLLDEYVSNEEVRKLIIQQLDDSNNSLPHFVGYFVHHMSTADCAINTSVIGEWLLEKATNNLELANEIYWEFASRDSVDRSRHVNMYKYWLEKWIEKMPQSTINRVLLSKTFADGCCNNQQQQPIIKKRNSSKSKTQSTIATPTVAPAVQSFFRKTDRVVSPTNITLEPAKIDLNNIKVLQSITNPLKIPLIISEDNILNILWKPEDIRKDYIVMNFIRFCDQILKQDLKKDFNIVTYNVRPIKRDSGFIQMVPNSTTLYDMDTNSCNLFNFVTGDSKIDDLREQFLSSCAAYSTLTYLLGAGDRHLHNIMLTKDARLFHIDYGYVMGADPKKKFGITKVPDMRIDQNIVTLLGSQEQYNRFKDLVDEIYNCLRKHAGPLTALLRLLTLSEPQIHIQTNFTEKKLMKEILTRFSPGENHEEARIQIINRIDNSTKFTTHYALVDGLHHLAQTNTVVHAIASGWHSLKNTFF